MPLLFLNIPGSGLIAWIIIDQELVFAFQGNGKRLDKNGLPTNGHAIPIYAAQQPSGPQFGPYIGYAPVSCEL